MAMVNSILENVNSERTLHIVYKLKIINFLLSSVQNQIKLNKPSKPNKIHQNKKKK